MSDEDLDQQEAFDRRVHDERLDARAETREECAAIGDELVKRLRNGGAINAVREYAAAIRAGGGQ